MRNQVFISYSRQDKPWLDRLRKNISLIEDIYPIDFWDDTKIPPGGRWKEKIQQALSCAKVAILLVSQDFLASDFIMKYELPKLLRAAREESLAILWVAVGHSLYEVTEINQYQAANDPKRPLESLSESEWKEALVTITRRIMQEAMTFIPPKGALPVPIEHWESEGGVVPLKSPFYIERPHDSVLYNAVCRGEGIVRIKGVRQVGKTSLLSRGMQMARKAGATVVKTDFELFKGEKELASFDNLVLVLGQQLAKELNVKKSLSDFWSSLSGPKINFHNYMNEELLGQTEHQLVWALDEVDQLFTYDYHSQFFDLLRTWFNARGNDEQGPWHRLTMLISYSTEPNLFLDVIEKSPFNVGGRIVLGDFSIEEVEHLNYLYGSPLRDRGEVKEYWNLVGGHPHLVRRGLNEMGRHNTSEGRLSGLPGLRARGYLGEQPFGDHLRNMLRLLTKDARLCDAVKGLLNDKPLSETILFHRLQSGGLIVGDAPENARIRCDLYSEYLGRQLN